MCDPPCNKSFLYETGGTDDRVSCVFGIFENSHICVDAGVLSVRTGLFSNTFTTSWITLLLCKSQVAWSLDSLWSGSCSWWVGVLSADLPHRTQAKIIGIKSRNACVERRVTGHGGWWWKSSDSNNWPVDWCISLSLYIFFKPTSI